MTAPLDYASMITPPDFGASVQQGLQIGNFFHQRREDSAFKKDLGAAMGGGAPSLPADAWKNTGIAGADAGAPPATQDRLAALQELAARHPDRAQEIGRLAQIEQARVKQAQDDAYQSRLQSFAQNPTPTGATQLVAEFPDKHAETQALWKNYNEAQQADILRTSTAGLGYLVNGNVDSAIKVVSDRKAALESQGVDTAETGHILDLLKSGDPTKIKSAQGLMAVALTGAVGEKAGPILKQLGVGAEFEAEQRRLDRQDAQFALSERRQAEQERHNAAVEARAASGGSSGGGGLKPGVKTLKPGVVMNGFRFNGGDPQDRSNWTKP